MTQENKNKICIYPDKEKGIISPYLYGACIEDVNHELYGGIWSQMIFGESFAEATACIDGFTAVGGKWGVEAIDGVNQITTAEKLMGGPLLLIDGTECTSGTFSSDVYVKGAGPSGFAVKVSNARNGGGDAFTGYEIGLFADKLRLARHDNNFKLIQDYTCNAPSETWVRLKTVMTDTSMTVYVNGDEIAVYTDPKPILSGCVGFRIWDSSAKFRNIKFSGDGNPEREIPVPDCSRISPVSDMWRSVIRGTAESSYELTTNNPFKNNHSQNITFVSGSGSVGINNMGLNRKGISFEKDKSYKGYFYARTNGSPATAYVVFESADGSVQYAEKSIVVTDGEWKKYSFEMISDTKDTAGRITVELRSRGSIDLGYIFVQPGEWGRYKGLPVRRDVAEKLEEQSLSLLRYGGSMINADGYKWKKMIGLPEYRPSYTGTWYAYSSFGFGIIEFLNLCEALGIAAVPDFNSFETPEDMADFVDYATGTDLSNIWVQKRMESDHPHPYDLWYIQIGNEEKINDDYAERFCRIAEAVWAKSDQLTLIVGDFDYKEPILDPYHFSGAAVNITTLAPHKKMLELARERDREVWIDIHFWTDGPDSSAKFFIAAETLYNQLRSIVPDTKVKLCVFEFNAQHHTFERALGNAVGINRAERACDIYAMVCSANCLQVDGHNDNGWDQGLVFMDNDSAWLQSPAYVTQMAHQSYNAILIDSVLEKDSPLLDVVTTKNSNSKQITLKIINTSNSYEQVEVCICERNVKIGNVTVTVLTSNSLDDSNPVYNKLNIIPKTIDFSAIESSEQGFTISLSPISYTVISIDK